MSVVADCLWEHCLTRTISLSEIIQSALTWREFPQPSAFSCCKNQNHAFCKSVEEMWELLTARHKDILSTMGATHLEIDVLSSRSTVFRFLCFCLGSD